MSTLLYDTLMDLRKRVEILEREVYTLKSRPETSLSAPKMNGSDSEAEVLAHILSNWETRKMGVQMRHLSQIYARKIKSEGGLRGLLMRYEAEGKISSLQTYTGATLLFPRDAFLSFSPATIDDIVYAGMPQAQRDRLRARAEVAKELEGPSEAELAAANAEALKKFGAQS